MSLSLKNTVLDLLSILKPCDRDLKTIAICSNPNHCYGSDRDVRDTIEDIIRDLIIEGIIRADKHVVPDRIQHGFKTIRIYSIK